ncbi:MAG: D-alanyl-D-alanine carboxypeptidase/D-alanyl-D-alanine-endopeptidase [Myxococcota bacterium]|nr:D-alanyl-D-alanine carboxypeptidase/D-alanyl-D-alanine-endopeptidase [Myxococcota bacterium]
MHWTFGRRLGRALVAAALEFAVTCGTSDVRSQMIAPSTVAEPTASRQPGRVQLVGSSSSGLPSDPVPELEAALHKVLAHVLEGATVGIAVVDIDSGRLLAALNEHLALNPASNAKLYTAGAALATLHAEHRYETTLTGKLDGDAVAGSLAIRGYGDPSLRTADLYDMVRELKGYGVRRVDGDIVVDQRFFDEQTTPPAFEQQPNEWSGFRAPVSALALDENCITLSVRPSARGAPARVLIEPPGFVDVDGTVGTGDDGVADNVELGLSGVGGRMAAKLSGTVAADSRVVRYTRRAEDPRLLAGYALKALLERAEVKVSGEVKLGSARGRTLARHQSEPLSALLYALGKQSDNFYAEMIFKSLAGEAKGAPARSGEAAQVVTEWLSQIGALDAGVVIKNGSGLFDANRVTAWSTVELLRWAWRDPAVQPEYIAQLSVGGVDGTLRKRFKGERTRRRVRAKTGTLDDAIALSGYVLRDPGKGPLAFSILFNHVAGKQDVARRAADRFVDALAKR